MVFGSAAGFGGRLDLGALDSTTGLRLDGIDAGDGSGRSVAGAGDVNGDGVDDLIVGASGADDFAGESYVVFGIAPPTLEEFEAEVLALTNEFRAANGIEPLENDARLNAAAEDWSQTMAEDDFVAHSTPEQVVEQGYSPSTWGENIAYGYETPESVVDGWINSPGHRANMLSSNFQEIGIGYFLLEDDTGDVNYNHYWTQVFTTELI